MCVIGRHPERGKRRICVTDRWQRSQRLPDCDAGRIRCDGCDADRARAGDVILSAGRQNSDPCQYCWRNVHALCDAANIFFVGHLDAVVFAPLQWLRTKSWFQGTADGGRRDPSTAMQPKRPWAHRAASRVGCCTSHDNRAVLGQIPFFDQDAAAVASCCEHERLREYRRLRQHRAACSACELTW